MNYFLALAFTAQFADLNWKYVLWPVIVISIFVYVVGVGASVEQDKHIERLHGRPCNGMGPCGMRLGMWNTVKLSFWYWVFLDTDCGHRDILRVRR